MTDSPFIAQGHNGLLCGRIHPARNKNNPSVAFVGALGLTKCASQIFEFEM